VSYRSRPGVCCRRRGWHRECNGCFVESTAIYLTPTGRSPYRKAGPAHQVDAAVRKNF
jgi:hypothetical protein